MKKLSLITLILSLAVTSAFAQQLPLYSNYFFTPYLYNPATSGLGGDLELTFIHRRQWTGIQGSPETSALALNGAVESQKWGYSLFAYNDQTDIVSRTAFYGNYAYHLRFSETGSLSFGLGAGYMRNNINIAAINVPDDSDPLLYPNLDGGTFDISFGLNLRISDFQFGFAAPQLLAPSVVYSENYTGPVQYNLIRHYIGNVQYDFKFSGDKNVLSPFIMVKMADNVEPQFDAGLMFDMKDVFFVGAAYRTDYAVTANAGVHLTDKLTFGYAYDFSLNEFGYDLGSSHEFMLSYKFGNSKKTDKIENKVKKMEDRLRKQEDNYEEMIDEKLEEFRDEIELEQQKANAEFQKELLNNPDIISPANTGGNNGNNVSNTGNTNNTGTNTNSGDNGNGGNSGNNGSNSNMSANTSSINGFPTNTYAKNVNPGSSGYYVTAGVFSSRSNAQKQVDKLKRKNVDANFFQDPSNNMFYVFVMKFNSYNEAKQASSSNLNGQYDGKLWIKVIQ